MAQISELSERKSKKTSKSCPSAILKAIPSNYQKISFDQLNENENYNKKAIIGKINHLNPIGRRVDGHIRKLLVTDGLDEQKENSKLLTVFLLDRFAQDSEDAEIEGYIILANFAVEKSTRSKENEFPFQILVKKDESEVWFGRKVISNPNSGNKKKKKKVAEPQKEPIILSNHYEYLNLGELHESEEKETFNVYGIVEKCDLKITQGKRTQILDLVLTDKTEAGFICSVYSALDVNFPDVYAGDIIRIHRMQVYKFRSKLKGKCLSSKFILVFSKGHGGLRPKTIAKSFTFTPEDAERVQDLFEWYDTKNKPKLISAIERGDFVNIICQVIGVYIAKKSEAVILKIWDGTKSNHIQSSHWGLPDEKLDEKLFSIAKNYYVVLSVYGQHCTAAGELNPGQFIEVRDAHLYSPKDNPDDCKLSLHAGNKEKRGIQLLNLDDNRITELKERLEKIIADGQELGNHTQDILSQNNSIFLNCDISALPTSQKSCKTEEKISNVSAFPSDQKSCETEEENPDIEFLNKPISKGVKEMECSKQIENKVISVVSASVKPGQSTQEFGEEIQREYLQVDLTQENELSPSTAPELILNKTPLEFRAFLHNPSSQSNSNTVIPPFTADTPEDWWNSLSAISTTEGHSDIKPSSLAEIVSHEVPYKFRALCVIFSFKPNITSIQELIYLHCPNCEFMSDTLNPSIKPHKEQNGLFYFYCPECATENAQLESILKYTYIISLYLHDGTISTDFEAYLWGENAVKFFKDISPEQALRDSLKADLVLQMLWNICPNCRPLNSTEKLKNNYSSYPILDCCIMSYNVINQTVYQIFDTQLL